MDVEQKIREVEIELSRLGKQQEQEEAMAQVLPLRFQQNMDAFKRNMPGIHDFFEHYQPTRPFRFFCNENGIPNILLLDTETALYGNDPFAEAEAQIGVVIKESVLQCIDFVPQWCIEGQIHIKYNNEISKLKQGVSLEGLPLSKALAMDIPLSLMYGIGLGYQLGYLYERCTVRNLFAFEPDLDMFYASLYCFDWHSLLDYMEQESLSLHLFIGVDEQLLVGDMMEALHRKGAFWSAAYFSFSHYHSPKLHSLVSKVESEFYLLRTGWGFFDDNIYALAHSYSNLIDGMPFLLRKREMRTQREVPVFVVGNGPSLDQGIDFIRQHQDRAIIIACGTAVSALHKAGVRPDIYVAVERTKSSADFLAILDADDFLKETVFLSVDVIHPECKRFFRRSGLAFKPNEPMFKLLGSQFDEEFEYDTIEFSNPFVGNTGLNYAALLGFKKVYLFGIDNGYKSADKHHSSLSLYYNEKQEAKYQENLAGTFPARGNFGDEVRINHLFGLAIHNMEEVLRAYPDLHCINSSDGAYVEGAIPQRVETLQLTGPHLDKRDLLDGLLDGCFAPFDVSRVDFDAALNASLFSQLVERLRGEWREVPRDRNAILAMMQRHHDYLIYLFMSRESHLYRVLIGSINYFYANVITLMMTLVDAPSDLFAERIEQAIAILDAFLADAEHIYADAFERHDTTYFSGLDVFKRK
ncbi:motility associated factor glycosyltransferase family protein [Aeromonas caviae]|uniref:Motility associated factor glycosyltransferase family protein n=1 Tax=Aeromonas caviae TaxID=648 RepID=A0A3S5WTR8_AERCA|nr:6-hydroxymethylpterin diphosphokinase MptE-like protein [Aeromonas caviae]AXB03718.1 motility associated factor glycosyltransferase family protein [Aeromonas caviae]AXB08051.1 motility associated factor glycosyltransferase family protein [Aeromonas caviae]